MPEDERKKKARREREAFEEWERRQRRLTAGKDLSDASPETEKIATTETQKEAIDRAAHTPGLHDGTAASEKRDRWGYTPRERTQMEAEVHRDLGQIEREKQRLQKAAPKLYRMLQARVATEEKAMAAEMEKQNPWLKEARGLLNEYKDLMGEPPPAEMRETKAMAAASGPQKTPDREMSDKGSPKESLAMEKETKQPVTDEQRARVNKALEKIELSREVSNATQVSEVPKSYEADRSRSVEEIGRDLQKQGVEMEK